MKKFYLLCAFTLIASFAHAQNAFITKWQIDAANTGIYTFIQSGPGVSYTIDFGDGTVLTNQNSYFSHFYTNPGTYTVSVTGTYFKIVIPSFNVNNLRSVEQWGTAQWTGLAGAFANCTNVVINATDAPDLSQVTSLDYMFSECYAFNQSINHWDVSNITSMERMFGNAELFNQPLDNWDVSNVTTFKNTFYGAASFNQPLNNWDVTGATSFEGMFLAATSFNQDISNWDVSGALTLKQMFSSATSFNQPLNSWDVSNVTDMTVIFQGADSFNQPLDNWDMSNVESIGGMFSYALSFNQPLNNWDVSAATTADAMFYYAGSFNQPLNNWNVSSVEWMDNMFKGATNFNQDISSWNFGTIYSGLANFLTDSGLDKDNYDALLLKFAQSGMQNYQLGAQGLQYCDAAVHNYLDTQLGWTFLEDSLSEECIGNVISGTVLYDENANGCDVTDVPVQRIFVSAQNSEFEHAWSTNAAGQYNMRVLESTSILGLLGLPDYFTVSPAQPVVTFDGTGGTQEQNFCVTANQAADDLTIVLLPVTSARPGFTAKYQLVVSNTGTQTVANALVSLVYDSAMQSFVSAVPASASVSAGQINFDIANLKPFEIRTINVTLLTAVPPAVNGGDVLHFTATVTPDANDLTPADNTFALAQVAINAFDPNDKVVLQGETIYPEQAGEYLDYIIRFQNTGTASATNVRIEDNLHANLDWATLRPVSASHDYTVQITDGGHVQFIFNNINLPFATANAEGSQGFIAYKVKPVQNIQVGDVMEGDAGIYFDYNLPVITNAVSTEVIEFLGVNDNAAADLVIYPNPVTNTFYLKAAQGTVGEIEIFNIQGRKLMHLDHNPERINIESLSAGVYILKVKANGTEEQRKLVKN